ncbi:uncharacterized protein BX664DRAFT_333631 [Halteromyces radiatus]|uniref:uncharacterized protein n=1 Tax=Halteromyces radiatus TaxID=101107 RepID=UPI002220ADB6|nr:uncharacterized protein BX664DRAFT_333631 [Halteromyces radiatus]KAI8089678.1 hypothetical protein BX664DRAFT_333631 [Halteromyces radiatus]
MLHVKRKAQDIDDWGLNDSSSDSSDSSSDEDDDQYNNNKRLKPSTSPLTMLPHELLCDIFILSSNPDLPLTCRTLYYHLYNCCESVKMRWLLYRHDNDIQAAFEAGVLFPFFTTDMLARFDLLYQTKIPYTKKKMPPHLFSRKRTIETDAMINQLLIRGGSPDKPKGYPLIKCAQLGHMDQVQLLIHHGANPTLRNNMALRVCAARNNMTMVLYFLDKLNVTPDSETLRACVQKKLWKMVQVLVDHGAVPDMNTVNFT